MSTDELFAEALRLPGLASRETGIECLKRQELEIRSRIEVFSASDQLPREELYS